MKTKPQPSPPKLAKKLLLSFLRDDLAEEVQGDLEEKYYSTLKNKSAFKAKLGYWFQVFNYLRPFAVKKSNLYHLTHHAMLGNYAKIGWRNLLKNKGYSFINIGGLAMGMTVAILIGLWVHDEFSFNKYHRNYDRIAQVMKVGLHDGIPWAGGLSLQYPLIEELKTNYAHNFEIFAEASQPANFILTSGQTKVSRRGQFIGAGAPEMLSLEMILGDWNCLRDPHSIVLSASASKALFGDADPLGKTVKINTDIDVKVTGVYKDLPHNTEFHEVKFFVPWELNLIRNPWIREQPWDNHFLWLYCLIAPNTTFEKVNENIAEAELKVIRTMDKMKERVAEQPRISLLPMSDWHLFADYSGWPNYGIPDKGPLRFVILIATIGGFVLFLACINFMNLSTARSEKRAREVGIRKSMGSLRRQLVHQFFLESYLVVILAFFLAVVLATVTLPWFNDLAAKQMAMPWTGAWFWYGCIAFIAVTGLLAGSYPALYLSSFNPVRVLKGAAWTGRLSSVPRRVLVVVQFTVSVTLIISTVIVYNQIVFAKQRPVGYTREGLIMVQKRSDDFFGKTEILREELKKTGVVDEIAESGGQVTNVWSNNNGFSWRGKDPDTDPQFGTLGVTPEYGSTVGWQFVDGRDFLPDMVSDSSGFVINESAARVLGFENPVGETVHWKSRWWKLDKDFTILGVVKDMVMVSPYKSAEPTIFLFGRSYGYFNVRISPAVKAADALPKIEEVFNRIIPTAPFEYEFAGQEYALKFAAEERIGKLSSVFSALAILISCLGLFGLASFVAERRTKELGIRKVLGASILQLWRLLSKDFVVLVVAACCIAVPISLYFMNDWLTQFEYRTHIEWQTFAWVILGAVMITLLTVSYQALKAAVTNPVDSLRNE